MRADYLLTVPTVDATATHLRYNFYSAAR